VLESLELPHPASAAIAARTGRALRARVGLMRVPVVWVRGRGGATEAAPTG
jgi:hypothetical protein